ncbi:MAG: hypothetical protein V2A62_04355 [Candidatus Woesearchaeota archaeon]
MVQQEVCYFRETRGYDSVYRARFETGAEAIALLDKLEHLKRVRIRKVDFTPEQVRVFTALPFSVLELICGENEEKIRLKVETHRDYALPSPNQDIGVIKLEALFGVMEKYLPESALKQFKQEY